MKEENLKHLFVSKNNWYRQSQASTRTFFWVFGFVTVECLPFFWGGICLLVSLPKFQILRIGVKYYGYHNPLYGPGLCLTSDIYRSFTAKLW